MKRTPIGSKSTRSKAERSCRAKFKKSLNSRKKQKADKPTKIKANIPQSDYRTAHKESDSTFKLGEYFRK